MDENKSKEKPRFCPLGFDECIGEECSFYQNGECKYYEMVGGKDHDCENCW